ncbi:MAG TPA: hypothetical protein VKD70_15395 [Candidatus Acidoferrum sp.]|nr:hypothetical protein [Candidatus Acidoferrum sp.]
MFAASHSAILRSIFGKWNLRHPSRICAQPMAVPKGSAYSGSNSNELVSGSFILMQPAATAVASPIATAVQTAPEKLKPAPPPAFSGRGKPNRRHVRTRANFTACIRANHSKEEVVECDNVCKGGLCFREPQAVRRGCRDRSRRSVFLGAARHLRPAQIRCVEQLRTLGLFRYGGVCVKRPIPF